MPNLKEIRNRISSVTSTMKITSAMKMVSAAKLKKAQDSVTAMRPYSEKLGELMSSFYEIISTSSVSQLSEKRVIKKAISLKNEPNFSKAKFSFLIIGKKANDIISKTENVISNHSDIFENINYDDTASAVDSIIELFSNGEFDHVELIYNTFKNAANQTTITEQFLPISKPEGTEALSDYIFEPSMEQIVSDLVPKSLKIQLYKAIRDSFAGEHGARMTAMHKATDNASELKSELVLTYNKARQAAITNEILEIVSGAEALNG